MNLVSSQFDKQDKSIEGKLTHDIIIVCYDMSMTEIRHSREDSGVTMNTSTQLIIKDEWSELEKIIVLYMENCYNKYLKDKL